MWLSIGILGMTVLCARVLLSVTEHCIKKHNILPHERNNNDTTV